MYIPPPLLKSFTSDPLPVCFHDVALLRRMFFESAAFCANTPDRPRASDWILLTRKIVWAVKFAPAPSR